MRNLYPNPFELMSSTKGFPAHSPTTSSPAAFSLAWVQLQRKPPSVPARTLLLHYITHTVNNPLASHFIFWNVWSLYRKLPTFKTMASSYSPLIPSPTLIMGNSNARHDFWEPALPRSHGNRSGASLLSFLAESDSLSLLTPPGLPTRIDPVSGNPSTLDMCLGNGPLLLTTNQPLHGK
ncbi:hypothetical protein E2C01_041521 [Portunus trituberculatus]|uniref:Endonuclease/exonuclease/phosphatase domain-containing protein n=1 Tax=Portunus trituberculatus TaxID=210409 RepID=A0A5B7FTS9_PORTR|nr:hypothetical protein [Portunus trituberculatus]